MYGQAGMYQNDSTVSKGGITITVNVQMPGNSPLKAIRSPSHPIAVVLGGTSATESQPPNLLQASATLSFGTIQVRCFYMFIPICDINLVMRHLCERERISAQECSRGYFCSSNAAAIWAPLYLLVLLYLSDRLEMCLQCITILPVFPDSLRRKPVSCIWHADSDIMIFSIVASLKRSWRPTLQFSDSKL